MTSKEELLAAFDDVYAHKWESMQTAFKNVTEDEANYQHESYRDAERYPGDPLPGTILWYAHHLAHCYDHYTEAIKRRPEKVPPPPPPEILPIDQMIELLKANRAMLREVVASLSEEALDEELASGASVADFIRASIRHDAWHSGQVAVARRLYRTRPI